MLTIAVRPLADPGPVPPERVIRFRARTVLSVLAIVLAVFATLQLIWLARQVITWILIALFLALALNPFVEFLQRRGIRRRGLAVGTAFLIALAAIAALGGTFIPIIVDEVNQFAQAVPGYIQDLTQGRGRLGFLETRYQIVERVREAVQDGGVQRVLGLSGAAVAITKGVVTVVIATITIVVLTFFMLLEGPAWVERMLSLLPPESQARWRRVGYDIYRTVGGFVSGALLIALIAGVSASIVLSIFDIRYAIALGLVVALLDLIPLAGATLATVLVSTIALLDASLPVGFAVLAYFVIYQQIENHVLYPTIYSRTVQLSPLVILIAVLIGASLAGILGALAAIPTAGAVQVILLEVLASRRTAPAEPTEPPEAPLPPAEPQPEPL